MPFPPYPSIPAPITHVKGEHVSAAQLRSDVENAILLLTQPPVFCGAQTGLPQPFTAAASSDLFTAPGTNYVNGQPVLLSSGSPMPGGFSAGTTYWTLNVSGDQFNLANTSGGGILNVTSNGAGTIQQTQVTGSSTTAFTPIGLDTGLSDPWSGWVGTSNPSSYFGMLPGVYLAEFICAPLYTGGAGTVSAGITAQEGAAQPVTTGGARMPNSATSGRYPSVAAVKLLVFSSAGSYGAAGNNYASGSMLQDSGGSVVPLATATRWPQLNLEWVAALTGNPSLPVPDNDAWPLAPDILGRTFLNKNVRDAIGFLAYRPVCEATYNAGSFSLAAQTSLPAVGTTIPLDTIHVDSHGAFDISTGVWTCLRPGLTDAYAQLSTAAASTSTSIAAGITVTSANYNSGSAFTVWGPAQVACTGSGQASSAVTRRRFRLAYGDTLKLAGFQSDSSSAASTCPSGTWKSRLITVWRAA